VNHTHTHAHNYAHETPAAVHEPGVCSNVMPQEYPETCHLYYPFDAVLTESLYLHVFSCPDSLSLTSSTVFLFLVLS
jgi:hypothetical protein